MYNTFKRESYMRKSPLAIIGSILAIVMTLAISISLLVLLNFAWDAFWDSAVGRELLDFFLISDEMEVVKVSTQTGINVAIILSGIIPTLLGVVTLLIAVGVIKTRPPYTALMIMGILLIIFANHVAGILVLIGRNQIKNRDTTTKNLESQANL